MFGCFVQVKDIPGECSDKGHEGWIQALSYSHGVSQRAAGAISGTGGISGQLADHSDFTIVKTLDKSSPKLALACCKGEAIGDVTVELCRAAGDKSKYMQYKMSDVIIRTARPSGSAKGSDDLPLEEIHFAYAKIEWTYTEFDTKNKPKGDVKASWDLATNTGS
jgi:type VI secretion system secreted protein Hcp